MEKTQQYNETYNKFIYNKKTCKSLKKFNTKESFQCFYILVIMIDSVYRKDKIYDPKSRKVHIYIYIRLSFFFWKSLRNFGFWGFRSSSCDMRKTFFEKNIRAF